MCMPRTSTLALTNATFPYARRLAEAGWQEACVTDRALFLGCNVIRGQVVYPGVGEAFGIGVADAEAVIAQG